MNTDQLNQLVRQNAMQGAQGAQTGGAPYTDVASYVKWLSQQPGADPTLASDPNYWIGKINETGGLTQDNIGYWNNRSKAGAGNVGGAPGGGGLPAGYSVPGQTGPYPLSPVTGPGLAQAFTAPFKVPTGTDDPGFQFAMQQGLQALDRSNAASGKLLTGGAIKDALDYSTGKALQGYSDAYNRAWQQYMGSNQIYNQNLNNIYSMLTGQQGVGQNATNAATNAGENYGTNATNLVTGQGNANAGAAIGKGNVGANTVNNALNVANPYLTGTNPASLLPKTPQGSGLPTV